MTLRQATEKARDPEVVARIVDPEAFEDFGPWRLTNTMDRIRKARHEAAFAKARRIIALFPDTLPLTEALEEAERALEAARKRMDNSRRHIESGQVSDKDVHGSLIRGRDVLDAALTQIKEALHG